MSKIKELREKIESEDLLAYEMAILAIRGYELCYVELDDMAEILDHTAGRMPLLKVYEDMKRDLAFFKAVIKDYTESL